MTQPSPFYKNTSIFLIWRKCSSTGVSGALETFTIFSFKIQLKFQFYWLKTHSQVSHQSLNLKLKPKILYDNINFLNFSAIFFQLNYKYGKCNFLYSFYFIIIQLSYYNNVIISALFQRCGHLSWGHLCVLCVRGRTLGSWSLLCSNQDQPSRSFLCLPRDKDKIMF